MWHVYLLKSMKRKWYYVGSTNDLLRRLGEHNNKKVVSTKAYVPFELVYSKEFEQERDARSYEKMLKQKRMEKEKIILQIESCRIV